MMTRIPILAAALVAALVLATAAAAGNGSDKVTICHQPDGAAGKTMTVPRSAWAGHEGHGDHEGACAAATSGTPPAPTPPTPPPTTTLMLEAEAEGHLDGDATFEVTIRNTGSETGLQLRVEGTLTGDGEWHVAKHAKAACSITDDTFSCDLSDLGSGGRRTLHLSYEGHATLCREAGIDLALRSSNDSTTDDDHAVQAVRVGACTAFGDDPP